MAISDFYKTKSLKVTEVSGQPTISRTVCLKITSGDDATTGTGEIVLDWSNIGSKADIGVYDESNNLLDYYFESFDATAETAVIWVFRDWVRDGTVQAKIAYGNGPSDQSVVASTVFSKESDLERGYLFNEDSGGLLDVSGNNNDGTVYGATRGETGMVDGAYSFDGSDDYVDTTNITSSDYSFVCWIKAPAHVGYIFCNDDGMFELACGSPRWGDCAQDRIELGTRYSNGNANTLHTDNAVVDDSWIHAVGLMLEGETADNFEIYINGGKAATSTGRSQGTGSLNDGLLTIGYRSGFGDYLNGIVAHATIHSSILSPDDILALYDATKSSPALFDQEAASGFATISGTVNLSGSGVENAKLFLMNDSTGKLEATTTTDADGNYSFDAISGDTYHVAVQYGDGSQKYNDYSKPYLVP